MAVAIGVAVGGGVCDVIDAVGVRVAVGGGILRVGDTVGIGVGIAVRDGSQASPTSRRRNRADQDSRWSGSYRHTRRCRHRQNRRWGLDRYIRNAIAVGIWLAEGTRIARVAGHRRPSLPDRNSIFRQLSNVSSMPSPSISAIGAPSWAATKASDAGSPRRGMMSARTEECPESFGGAHGRFPLDTVARNGSGMRGIAQHTDTLPETNGFLEFSWAKPILPGTYSRNLQHVIAAISHERSGA